VTVLRRLMPEPGPLGDTERDLPGLVRVLAALYAYPDPAPDDGWVRANMIATLDGSATGADDLSGSIGGPADRAVFSALRAVADVVLVGAGTARAERYRLPAAKSDFAEHRRRHGQSPAPVLAVLSRSGRLPEGLAGAGVERVLTLTGPLTGAIRELAGRGLRRILLEGGPGVLGQAVAAGLVDELCLTLSPRLVGGDGPRIATGAPGDVPMRLAHLLEADGMVIGRWFSASRQAAHSFGGDDS
jgi:riboflavin biosynthesis pyrimidine reductase